MRIHALMAALLPIALGACSTVAAPPAPATLAPAQWQAPLPHGGQVASLSGWWREQGDPLLVQLVEAAQAASPSIATAQSRIAQSRAQRVAAGAALVPNVDLGASVSRSNQQ